MENQLSNKEVVIKLEDPEQFCEGNIAQLQSFQKFTCASDEQNNYEDKKETVFKRTEIYYDVMAEENYKAESKIEVYDIKVEEGIYKNEPEIESCTSFKINYKNKHEIELTNTGNMEEHIKKVDIKLEDGKQFYVENTLQTQTFQMFKSAASEQNNHEVNKGIVHIKTEIDDSVKEESSNIEQEEMYYKNEQVFKEQDVMMEDNCKTEEIEVHDINLDGTDKAKQETEEHNDVTAKDNFKTEASVKRNLKSIFSEKSYKCKLCSKSFTDSSCLTVHSRTHSGEKPYKCDLCGRKFSQCVHLKQHLRTHSGEKPFKCSLCAKSFSVSAGLKLHSSSVHSDEKPFKCNFCHKSFSFNSSLKAHFNSIHANEKPYKCKFCKSSFNQESHLTVHLQCHTDEKPYKCELCSKSFNLKLTLTRHLIVHTGGKPYECNLCSRSFSRKYNFLRHSKTHTGEK